MYTANCILLMAHCNKFIVHFTKQIEQITVYNTHCTHYTLPTTNYIVSPQSQGCSHIVYTVQCTLHIVNCTPYTAHCTLYIVHYTPYTIHRTLYTVHTVQRTLYTEPGMQSYCHKATMSPPTNPLHAIIHCPAHTRPTSPCSLGMALTLISHLFYTI